MATKRERIKTLKEWAEYLPELTPWGDQSLIKRNGAVISGICFDKTSNKNIYEAVYFMATPIDSSFVYSLNYSRRYKGKYAAKSLKYDTFDPNDANEFKKQFPLIEKQLTFNDFFIFIEELFDRDQMMTAHPPSISHMLRDIAIVGTYCGDKDFYVEQLPLGKKLLEGFDKDFGVMNPTNVDIWRKDMLALLNTNLNECLEEILEKENLINLTDNGMKYERIDNYLQRLKTAIYSFYPALQRLIKKT